MKTKIKYTDIISRNPCYDPIEIGMKDDYEASIIDFIKEYRSKVKDKQDIFWVVINRDYMTKIESLEFSLFAANRVKHLMKDERSFNALRVTELYLKGKATKEELDKAAAAAYDATADAAAGAAAGAADAAAAAYAAYNAAYAAAATANAANTATYAANAAAAAADAAANAAYAARAAAGARLHEINAQIDKLIEIFEKRKTL